MFAVKTKVFDKIKFVMLAEDEVTNHEAFIEKGNNNSI